MRASLMAVSCWASTPARPDITRYACVLCCFDLLWHTLRVPPAYRTFREHKACLQRGWQVAEWVESGTEQKVQSRNSRAACGAPVEQSEGIREVEDVGGKPDHAFAQLSCQAWARFKQGA